MSNRDIIADYGEFTEKHSFNPTRIEDVSILPHPKKLILHALLEEIRNRHPRQMHEYLKIGAAGLAQYQPNVGPVPLEQLGMDISKFTKMDVETLKREVHLLVEAGEKTCDKFNAFNKLVEADLALIEKQILANEGYGEAQYELACLYWQGEGIPQNYVLAYMWFGVSLETQSPDGSRVFFTPAADQQMEELTHIMSAAEIAEAERLTHDWLSKHKLPS